MKKHIYGSIIIISLVFCVQHTSSETLRMGYFLLPPHQYTDPADGAPRGGFVTYFELVAAKMGYDVEWVGPLPLLRLVDYLKKDETLDGAIGFPKYPAFETFLYYPDTHFFLARPTLIVQKENPLTQIRSIEDIQGYHIGAIKTASGRYTPLIDDNPDAVTVEEIASEMWFEQNIRKLLVGRLDALYDRQPYTILFTAAQLNLASQLKELSLPDSPFPSYVVFSQASKRGKKLLEQYNALIPQLSIDYEELVRHEIEAVMQQQ